MRVEVRLALVGRVGSRVEGERRPGRGGVRRYKAGRRREGRNDDWEEFHGGLKS